MDGPVVADARFIRDEGNSGSAEVAITVADAYQGRGIGTLLLVALAVAARSTASSVFHARALSDNPPARSLGEKVNARCSRRSRVIDLRQGDIPSTSMTYPWITTHVVRSDIWRAR